MITTLSNTELGSGANLEAPKEAVLEAGSKSPEGTEGSLSSTDLD